MRSGSELLIKKQIKVKFSKKTFEKSMEVNLTLIVGRGDVVRDDHRGREASTSLSLSIPFSA